MKVFVTGGTGLLGGSIINELNKQNYKISALIRSKKKSQKFFDSKINLIEGDLQNIKGFEDELKEMDVLIHAAACYSEYYRGSDKNLPFDVNVKGTLSLFEAAYNQGVRNAIYISSSAVLQTHINQPTDESAPYADGIKDAYFQSKIDAEKEVIHFIKTHTSMRVILILPTVMLGPGDRGPTPTGNFILNFLNGKVKFNLPGSMKIVDVRDVANAVAESITKGKSGERYLIGGQQYPISQILRTLGEISGNAVPSKSISPKKIILVARIMQLISKITGKPPALKVTVVKRLLKNYWYDSSKAQKEFGIQFRLLKETLSDTVDWFQSNGSV